METIRRILVALGVESFKEMRVSQSYTVEVNGFEDLSIERIGEKRLCVGQYYTQRGDLMGDPEVIFIIEDKEWRAVRYTQYPMFHQHDEDGLDIEEFLQRWGQDLRDQGFIDAAEDVSKES